MSLNTIRPWRNIYRRKSRQIMVGKVAVGGDAPISVQTMTNTLTSDVKATIEQVQRCAAAGADIVRISTPDQESTRALRSHCARKARCRSWPTSISTTNARLRRPRRALPVCASTPAISGMPSAWPR